MGRPPMGDLSINVEPSGAFSSRKGHAVDEQHAADVLVRRPPSRLDAGPPVADRGHQVQLEYLPGFKELFGPQDLAPKPADKPPVRPSSHLSSNIQTEEVRPDLAQIPTRSARFGPPAAIVSPIRRLPIDVTPDHVTSRKRKSELVEDGSGHALPAWRSISQPIPGRVHNVGEPPPIARPYEASVPSMPPRTLGSNNWVSANEPRPARLLPSPPRPGEIPGVAPEYPAHFPGFPRSYDPVGEARTPQKRPRLDRSIDIGPELDVSSVHLEGEPSDRVKVFDNCDVVRLRIHAFLRKPGMTQAAFLRAIAATYSDGRRLQGAQLNRFLSMSGPHSGNTSGIFYAAYVFFEKLRLRDRSPKSPERLEMERHHPDGFNISEVRSHLTASKGPSVGATNRKTMPE